MKPELHTAANGYLSLEFGDYDSPLAPTIARFLESELSFCRSGPSVAGMGEGISPNFERDDLVIAAGRDNWSGQYFLSSSVEGDDLLRKLFSAITPNNTFNPDALKRAG